MRGRLCALASLLLLASAPAAAAPWPEPERPINQPTFVDLGAVAYAGDGYDGGFEGDGLGLRAGILFASARPLWMSLRGTYHQPLTDDDPALLQGDLLVGRSLWTCDCALLQDGELRVQVPRYGVDAAGERYVRQYDPRPAAGRPRTVRFAADLVVAAGGRVFMFIGDNPDGSHLAPIFIPQAGLWYHQQHLLAGRPGRLRVALLGAYDYRREAAGLFGHAEAVFLGHLHVAADAGGLFGDDGGRELSITLGYEL